MQTAFDVIEYLLATTGGGAQDQEHRVLRQALFHAYRDLVSVRDWRWYHAHDEITLDPTKDIYTHTLPWGVQSVDSMQLSEPSVLAEFVNPTEWDRLAATSFRQLVRLVWTVKPSEFSPDRWDVKILNGYRYGEKCTLTYRRRPRDLRCTGWEPSSRAGTINWSGTEVIGTGTAFNNQMLGAVLRVSGDSAYHPESLAGMHPYRDEGLISGIPNSQKLYAWTPASNVNSSGTKYIVTDYLDISPNMYTALLSGTESWMARLLGKNIEGATGVYGRDLRLAFEQDAIAPLSGQRQGNGWYYPFWYLRPGSDAGGVGGGGHAGDSGQCPIKPHISGGDALNSGSAVWDGGSASTNFGACGDAQNR
jgi:hypothetical protein